nr:MAG TPA: Metchnikowin family [Caudoviricetes sp.]
MQKTMLSAVGAALLALMAAVGSVIAEILRR